MTSNRLRTERGTLHHGGAEPEEVEDEVGAKYNGDEVGEEKEKSTGGDGPLQGADAVAYHAERRNDGGGDRDPGCGEEVVFAGAYRDRAGDASEKCDKEVVNIWPCPDQDLVCHFLKRRKKG